MHQIIVEHRMTGNTLTEWPPLDMSSFFPLLLSLLFYPVLLLTVF